MYECGGDNVAVALGTSAAAGAEAEPAGRAYRKKYLSGRNALPGDCGLGYLTTRGSAPPA